MRAHGVNGMLICPPGNFEPVLERDGDRVVASFPMTDKAMAELKRQGFGGPIAYYPRLLSCRVLRLFDRVDGRKIKATTYYGTAAVQYRAEDFPQDLKPVMKVLFRQMVQHAKDAGRPTILRFLVDEPSEENNEWQWAKLEIPLFRAACPNEPMLCTAYSLKTVEALDPEMEVRVCDLWRIDDAYFQHAQTWGIRWLCQHNNYHFPRHYAGMGLEKIGLDGFTEWTYYGAPLYLPYDQLRNAHSCHCAFVNEQGELLSTITWEAVQEGINDARYAATLRQLIVKAQNSDMPQHRSLAGTGRRTLEQVMAALPPLHQTLPPAKLRAVLAERIVEFVESGVVLN